VRLPPIECGEFKELPVSRCRFDVLICWRMEFKHTPLRLRQINPSGKISLFQKPKSPL
jgi:hypothetical protein